MQTGLCYVGGIMPLFHKVIDVYAVLYIVPHTEKGMGKT